MTSHFSQTVAGILEDWLELSGSSINREGRMTIGELLMQLDNKSLADAMEVDPEGLSALLLASKTIYSYLDSFSYTLNDLIEHPIECQAKVSRAAQLLEKLNAVEVRSNVEGFKNTLQRAFVHYGVNSSRSQDLLLDEILLGELRMAALKSMNKLQLDQFTKGKVDEKGHKPSYNGVVHRFLSTSALVDSAIQMKSNISLSLVQNGENSQHSFYVFAVRNGGNVYLLSDLKSNYNPMGFQGSQSGSIDSNNRIDQHHFPYEVSRAFIKEGADTSATESVASNLPVQFGCEGEAWPMVALVDLPDESLVWTIMMFELIARRFWGNEIPELELSMTGAMAKHQALLSRFAQGNDLVDLQACDIDFKPLSQLDVTSVDDHGSSFDEGSELDKKINGWMAERYGDKAATILENLDALELSQAQAMDKIGNDVIELDEGSRPRLGLIGNNRIAKRSQMADDRRFLARLAWAKEVERLAAEEFVNERKKVIRWYHQALEANIDALVAVAGKDNEYFSPYEGATFDYVNRAFTAFGGHSKKDASGKTVAHRMMQLGHVSDLRELGHNAILASVRLTKGEEKSGKPACALTGSVATFCAYFQPKCPEDLAWLTGVSVGDLPVFLQNWFYDKPYTGNPTFGRYDPLISNVENPWYEEKFGVLLYLSKRVMNKAREGFDTPLPEKKTKQRGYYW